PHDGKPLPRLLAHSVDFSPTQLMISWMPCLFLSKLFLDGAVLCRRMTRECRWRYIKIANQGQVQTRRTEILGAPTRFGCRGRAHCFPRRMCIHSMNVNDAEREAAHSRACRFIRVRPNAFSAL